MRRKVELIWHMFYKQVIVIMENVLLLCEGMHVDMFSKTMCLLYSFAHTEVKKENIFIS